MKPGHVFPPGALRDFLCTRSDGAGDSPDSNALYASPIPIRAVGTKASIAVIIVVVDKAARSSVWHSPTMAAATLRLSSSKRTARSAMWLPVRALSRLMGASRVFGTHVRGRIVAGAGDAAALAKASFPCFAG